MGKSKKMGSDRDFKKHLDEAVLKEGSNCKKCYLWLEEHMPPSFFDEVSKEDTLLIVHSLMGFDLQDHFAQIHLKNSAIVLCLDSSDADLRILKHYQWQGIKDYRTFVSNAPPPFPKLKNHLRIAIISFTTADEIDERQPIFDSEEKKEIRDLVKARNLEMTDAEFRSLLGGMSSRFIRAMTKERLIMALDMFFRAKSRDNCQYEVRYNEDWDQYPDAEIPSMQLVFSWRNVPKHHFLYHFAQVVHRHNLSMRRVSATYIDPHSPRSILIMSVALHGAKGQAAWEECDIRDFLQEVVTIKYFEGQEIFDRVFIEKGLVRGNLGHFIKAMTHFIHQSLTHADINMYSLASVEEGLCRHPELTVKLCEAFEYKFHPEQFNLKKYEKLKRDYLALVADLDTGNESNDTRRKNILHQGVNFIEHTLKTNFYRNNKTALSFRLDPKYLNYLPYDRTEKFPELPYAIFFIKGMFYIGFHIRFKDLSRGGLRTVFPRKVEEAIWERNHVFGECYNLSYTQQKKNKDIPEGGAKGIIFLEHIDQLKYEVKIFKDELKSAQVNPDQIKKLVSSFKEEQKTEFLYASQRSFIEAFVTLLNCEPNGKLRAKHIVDYYRKPEYIYLGPDENMHNVMIDWIANYAEMYQYTPGRSFITSKPSGGINHKEYGVTSYGVNVYMKEVLRYLGIDPYEDPFTVKMSGGPDGDVAGNQILNLYRFFRKTAKLLALIDVSGTIYDPKGLDLKILAKMFEKGEPIRNYPPEKLNEGGFLLDLFTKREQTAYAQQTLCWKKKKVKVAKEWLSGNEMNHILRHNVHQTITDIFIPGGGRPKTLNKHNYTDFLDETGKPTSRAIVEGANLYLTKEVRRNLEKEGVLIIKDSSANKGGVICSSLEVLTSLIMSNEEFVKNKEKLMPSVLDSIASKAKNEGQLLLTTYAETGAYLTEISDWISDKINTYSYQILDYLEKIHLSNDPNSPLMQCLLNYCPPFLRKGYEREIIEEIPDIHKKAMIATYIASKIVYTRGLGWSPSIVDILPIIATDIDILSTEDK